MSNTTELDLEGMRRRLRAASPGPWSNHGADVRGPDALIFAGRDGDAKLREQADRDAEFVANVRQDFAALLDLLADRPRPPAAHPDAPALATPAAQAPAGAKHRRRT